MLLATRWGAYEDARLFVMVNAHKNVDRFLYLSDPPFWKTDCAPPNIGPVPTSGIVTVSDTLPAGLTPSTASGAGWSCAVAGQAVTCTRSDALAAAGSYPAITIVATVAQAATSPVTNTATVAGGGEVNTANDSASDITTIISQADIGVAKVASSGTEIMDAGRGTPGGGSKDCATTGS